MDDTIKTFLNTDKLKTSALTVKLVKEFGHNTYIVADKSMVAVLDINDAPSHSKHLLQGFWFKLIKCTVGEGETIKINKVFKPIKTKLTQEIDDLDIKVEEFEKTFKTTASTKRYHTFESLFELPNYSKIAKLTIKVISRSRVIPTNKGNYQICTIKDSDGNTSSLNLYSKQLNTLEPFKIYTLYGLRKGEVTKNDMTQMRLHTTSFTKIDNGDIEDLVNFEQVSNGEGSITGTLIGIGEITPYQSCKIHFKKLDDELQCPSCVSSLKNEDILNDFKAEFYIETQGCSAEEQDIKDITIFKRVLNHLLDPNKEAIEEQLNELEGKTAMIDYNKDDAERLIAVSIKLMK